MHMSVRILILVFARPCPRLTSCTSGLSRVFAPDCSHRFRDFCFSPPDPIFYAGVSVRSWNERFSPLKTSHVAGYGRCEQLFTLFLHRRADAICASFVGCKGLLVLA